MLAPEARRLAALALLLALAAGDAVAVTDPVKTARPAVPAEPPVPVQRARAAATAARRDERGGVLTRPQIRELVRAFEESRERSGIDAFVLSQLQRLGGVDDPAVVDAALEVFRRGEVALFRTARQVLAGIAREASLERLDAKGLGSREPVVRAQCLLALGEGRPAGLDYGAAIATGLADREPVVRAAAVHAAGRARCEGAAGAVLALAGDASVLVRQEVPGCLVRLVGARSLGAIDQLARDASWRVRLGAIEALADLKSRAGVEALVAALGREQGRLREDAVAALRRLTGQPFGFDAGVWTRWLATAGDDFLARADAAALDPSPGRYAGEPGVRRYHDVSTASRRFVLVTDRSGSMARVAPGEAASNMTLATEELVRLIGSLDETFAFDLVAFSDRVEVWRGALVTADAEGRERGIAEVRSYRTDGATNVFEALDAALSMAEAALEHPAGSRYDRVSDPDTVFLLSDGVPTVGDIVDTTVLLEHVAERNRTLRLRIHCISYFDDRHGAVWLEELAGSTGGACVHKSW